ncbi:MULTISPECIES: metal ABC transporter permease [Pantoea]|uniref:Iron ABC transporter n=2 Tax=Pantoea stewartii TaxID=66269 RepID=H3R988_PANSE|nr:MULTISPECIES: metal ABC transporter permease [Pantoea]ARF51208.1 iron ABC transporter [Pantoea stewartii subsp. stewartii DC283]EHU01751.1 permease component of an ABC superfamily zinc transporter [Pantoea stewartii subsp. stewartii DC283]KAB0559029.1 metal ABC transporter permease [Pantoea stewartii subsp. stewartii]KGD84503.1 iron ABC transporter [Pantoea stewartii subsp. indologenes]KHD99803.1 iron ABC transporter [Pantoea stewartii]
MTLIQPFIEFSFMRRALVACIALAFSATPLGVFLSLRRMSLIGDALSHAVLPGAAIGYLISGLSLVAMGVGGLIAGLAVALLSGAVSRYTPLKEDASFAGFYLGSLALGVTLVSLRGSSVDLLHVLFGSLLAVDNPALIVVGSIAAFTLLMLAVIYRPLVIDAFDADFLRAQGKWSAPLVHGIFLTLVVLNLVAGFQVLGTLMSVGLMMLPAASARFWSRHLVLMLGAAMLMAVLSAFTGLVLSWHFSLPAGPAVVLSAAMLFFLSILTGPCGGILRRH